MKGRFPMRYYAACLCALVLMLGFADVCLAHRVNVFAYVDADSVRVECAFSKSRKVRNGKLVITDGETGVTLLEGVSDEQGLFTFRPSDGFLRTGHGLRILLLAGEGHQDEWRVSAEELAALSEPVPGGEAPASSLSPVPASGPAASVSAPAAVSSMDAAALEALVGRVVEAKLTPVRQALARQQESGPGLRDVIGGIGWILGLLGLGTYMNYRR